MTHEVPYYQAIVSSATRSLSESLGFNVFLEKNDWLPSTLSTASIIALVIILVILIARGAVKVLQVDNAKLAAEEDELAERQVNFAVDPPRHQRLPAE